jgi:diguanylate cyclase (GGDEF)-like protein
LIFVHPESYCNPAVNKHNLLTNRIIFAIICSMPKEVSPPEFAHPAPVHSEAPYGPHPPSIGDYKEVYEKSRRDQMTGLLNKEAFKSDVAGRLQLAERGRAKPALIYIDLDKFKLINDTHGHGMGDKIINAIAATLRHNEAEVPDFAGRLGGDEFGFLVDLTPRTDNQQAEEERLKAIVERVRENFAALLETAEFAELEKIGVGVSVGSAVWRPGVSAQELVDTADQNMYQQKNGGKSPAKDRLQGGIELEDQS